MRGRGVMKITDYLIIQHRLIQSQLNFLKDLKESRRQGDVSGIKEMIFLIHNSMRRHSGIETDYLFPALRPYLGEEMGTRAVIEFEHRGINEILEKLRNADDPKTIQVESSRFIIYLRDHIAKEENILFPMAEESLGKECLEDMAKEVGILDQQGKLTLT